MPSFFMYAPATTEIYTLSLHDALPIYADHGRDGREQDRADAAYGRVDQDRKSTRLNSSHVEISYAVFCLKKKMNGEIGKATLYARVGDVITANVYEARAAGTV